MKYGYIVSKDESYYNQYPDNTVLGLFETESGAMDFIAEMIEKEKAEYGVLPEYPLVNRNSDAKTIYSVDFIYKNEDDRDPDFEGETRTTYKIDRYEIK